MFIIGIAGGTGSGKTTVVNKILERIPRSRVADVIVPQGGKNEVAISVLLNTIEKKLSL